MKIKEWFGLALRVTGVVTCIYGAVYLLDALLFRFGYLNYPESVPGYFVITGLFHLLIGLYLIRGAPLLIGFAYPFEEEEEKAESEEEAAEQQDA
ncbi:MAG TPA: hypothetical protein VMZ30_20595 [Pyrinomonadaceae bacterium]|nr:hypothetical protein [Pyrinomonadaceae bacterium]